MNNFAMIILNIANVGLESSWVDMKFKNGESSFEVAES